MRLVRSAWKLSRSRARAAALMVLAMAGCAGVRGANAAESAQPTERDAGADSLDSGAAASCSIGALTPPAMVLSSRAGDQSGEQSSFCSNDERAGCGVCIDRAMSMLKRFTIAHAADQVTVSMTDGTLITPGPDTCQPACPPQLEIRSLCSNQVLATRTFGEDRPWTVDLAAGVYQIDVDASFSAGNRAGSTSSSFGLIVDDTRERGIVDDPTGAGCGKDDAGSAP